VQLRAYIGKGVGAEMLEILIHEAESKPAELKRNVFHGSRCQRLRVSSSPLSVGCSCPTDAGRTELAAGTVTALAIGPAEDRAVDKITGSIPLL
jgi:hypothetical protein